MHKLTPFPLTLIRAKLKFLCFLHVQQPMRLLRDAPDTCFVILTKERWKQRQKETSFEDIFLILIMFLTTVQGIFAHTQSFSKSLFDVPKCSMHGKLRT